MTPPKAQHDVVKIAEIIQENPTVRTFIFDYSVNAKPGQFVDLWIPGVNEKPFSVAYDDGKQLWLTICAVGETSKKMFEFKVGDRVGIRGPFGTNFTFSEGQTLALLGGGYGAAPLYFVAKEALKSNCQIEFIVGARNQDLLLYIERLKKLPNVNLHIATDDGSVGHKGYNTELLEQVISQKKIDTIMTCGPEMMMKRVSDIAAANNINAQISVERYMKCGFGICGNCTVDDLGIRTCSEGPVMPNEIARQITEFGKYHRDAEGMKHYW